MTITSPHNDQLKEIRKLAGRKWRDKVRLFVAEGEDLLDAAARQEGLSYSQFMHGLRDAGIELDRKALADIAVRDPETFRRFAERAREAAAA